MQRELYFEFGWVIKNHGYLKGEVNDYKKQWHEQPKDLPKFLCLDIWTW